MIKETVSQHTEGWAHRGGNKGIQTHFQQVIKETVSQQKERWAHRGVNKGVQTHFQQVIKETVSQHTEGSTDTLLIDD